MANEGDPTPSNPNPAEMDSQQRKAAKEEQEYYEKTHGLQGTFQYKKPIGPERPPVNPNQYKQPAGPTREDKEEHEREELRKRQEKFQKEQEEWNLKQKMARRDEEYRKEQEEVQKKNKLPTFGERAGKAAGAAIGSAMGPLYAVREKNLKPKQKGENTLTKADVAKMINQKKYGKGKGKSSMSGGQFHAPSFGGGFGSPLGNLDPFAGLGGRLGGKSGKKGGMPKGMDPFAGLPGKKGPGMFPGSDKAKVKKKFGKMSDWFKF